MAARSATRRPLRLLPIALFLTVALPVATAAAQAPGVPRTFNVTRIDSPEPRGGGSFGWGVASADLTGDGKLDLIVPQSQDPTSSQVFVFDGSNGAHIDTIKPPELNPDANPDPVLAFTYVETMPDVGSCPGRDGADADKICDAATVGPGDDIPEIIVGARALRMNANDSSLPATTADPALGRGYIIDGATRAVLKRVDMPKADRLAQAGLSPVPSPQFARTMISAQAMAPCAGSRAENNDHGIGPCPPTPRASRIGDLNGDGIPDIIITARNYVETSQDTGILAAASTSQCQSATTDPAPPVRCTAGKAWTYSGAIAGTNPRTILDQELKSIKNPLVHTTGGGEFGGNLYRIGDINTNVATTNCEATPGTASCAPEFVIPARNLSYPFANPSNEFNGVGAAFLFDGNTANPIVTPGASATQPAITSPEPQKLSQFGGSFNGGRAVGDLGANSLPDILLPAALQNAAKSDDGKIWVFNGVGGGGGATGSWQFASMIDPEPQLGGNFGGAFTGIGNIADGPQNPANELLVGGFHFDSFTEISNTTVADVNFVNVQSGRNLMTVPSPEGRGGDGFGVGLVPMGDLNGDGFLDFASTAYLANGPVSGGQGRGWIFTSDNSPPPAPPTAPPAAITGPAAPVAAPLAAPRLELRPGSCANRTMGTDRGERIRGTIAGDEIFGFGGNDTLAGVGGEDCIDAGTGNDRVSGGANRDKLVGGAGRDSLRGQDGPDELFGGAGNDRVDGGFGSDRMAGGAGNDFMLGYSDADRIFGEGGKDRIIGGSGRDYIDAGDGNDSIDVRNGDRDRVLCGRGRDRVRADTIDRLNSCEIITTKKARKAPQR